jgi:hypothetical protein
MGERDNGWFLEDNIYVLVEALRDEGEGDF